MDLDGGRDVDVFCLEIIKEANEEGSVNKLRKAMGKEKITEMNFHTWWKDQNMPSKKIMIVYSQRHRALTKPEQRVSKDIDKDPVGAEITRDFQKEEGGQMPWRSRRTRNNKTSYLTIREVGWG